MKIVKEFRDFAMRGNVVDMAVGIIIGGAFGKIVTSLVNDVIMPPIGMLLGQVDFKKLELTLKAPLADGTGGAAIKYGMFINTVLDFVIVAFCIFMVIKAMNAAKKKEAVAPAAPPAPPKQEVLLEEIRDLLKKK
jgi:large conductance mechanosensitive channel